MEGEGADLDPGGNLVNFRIQPGTLDPVCAHKSALRLLLRIGSDLNRSVECSQPSGGTCGGWASDQRGRLLAQLLALDGRLCKAIWRAVAKSCFCRPAFLHTSRCMRPGMSALYGIYTDELQVVLSF